MKGHTIMHVKRAMDHLSISIYPSRSLCICIYNKNTYTYTLSHPLYSNMERGYPYCTLGEMGGRGVYIYIYMCIFERIDTEIDDQ